MLPARSSHASGKAPGSCTPLTPLADVADVVINAMLSNCSVLESAAAMGCYQLLEALLERLPRLGSSSGSSRKLLAGAGADPTLRPRIRSDLSASVAAAVTNGHTDCLKLLLMDSGIITASALAGILDARNSQGFTLLMQAASKGDVESMRVLLEHHPSTQVAAVAGDGRNALMLAAEQGHAGCLQLLLDHGPEAQLAATDRHEWNALMRAAARGHAACMRLLLARTPGVQVTACDGDGSNALICATALGHAACVELLLAHSPEPQAAALDSHGCSALVYASSNAHVKCLQLLLPHSRSQQQLDEALLLAVRKLAVLGAQQAPELRAAGLRCIQLLLGKGAKLSRRVQDGELAAMLAVVQELAS